MQTIDERISKAQEKLTQLQQKKRIELRKKHEEEKKKNQRRNYILGEMVTKYFPQVLKLDPGNKAENAVIFKPFENFLSKLAADQKNAESLAKEIDKSSIQNHN